VPRATSSTCTVYMTDATYFDRTGAQSDWHITPELTRGGMLMPPGLHEEAEGVFTFEGQPENAIEELSRRGFRRSAAFDQLYHNPAGDPPQRHALDRGRARLHPVRGPPVMAAEVEHGHGAARRRHGSGSTSSAPTR
jgi:hypothetical protein